MSIIIETDIGRDADDLFALLYFIGVGVKIDAIMVSPGDHDQVAVVKSLLSHFNIAAPVLTPSARVVKNSITPFHQWVIETLNGNPLAQPDGHEEAVPTDLADVFICGPAKMAHLANARQYVFQGGFVPYSEHRPAIALDKFEGKETCATFNLGGTKPSVWSAILDSPKPHRWVGKNVCHTVVYTPEIHQRFCLSAPKPSEAHRLHRLFVEKYMEKHGAKAFHDPLAATLMFNPDMGIWRKLKPYRERGEWGAKPTDEEHMSLVDLSKPPWEAYFAGLNGSSSLMGPKDATP